ncbi:putative uncharacterized protein [Brachyspira suanatina]|uniref:Amidase domain-containing protein n=1 Tax=Brachyspira suanatina TaxID=381802 RepID=A0A0G4K6U2_9SPIR|nr:amidase family protein [Brachyspira suanatina]CRF33383.1 putative uncharacterized protein [Brachyspira suanatina]
MNIKILSGIYRTNEFIGKSVKEQNPNVILDLFKIDCKNWKTFGVKNTTQIDNSIIQIFLNNDYVWNTLDNYSDRGRAIDLKLINPISGKIMSGSSSGSAINVLYGLNTISIATDGGGSVLAPAISLNLYSILLSGIGLKGNLKRKSTDNIDFVPGIGIIAQNFEDLFNASKLFLKENFNSDVSKKLNILLTSEFDSGIIDKLKDYELNIIEDKDLFSREDLILELNNIFSSYDIFIYLEKDIDVEGIGDSVFGMMGEKALYIQKKSNKKYIKVLNMLNCTALTIPTGELGTSIVIAAKEGNDGLYNILEIAKAINQEFRPKLFIDYFLDYPLKDKDNRLFKI